MKTFNFAQLLFGLILSANVHATIFPVSQDQLVANCYPSSPMLLSDVCHGQIHSGYRYQQGDPFSEIYSLMNAMEGRFSTYMNPSLEYSANGPMLWQNTSFFPDINSSSWLLPSSPMPMVK